jgi:hypothetical protein
MTGRRVPVVFFICLAFHSLSSAAQTASEPVTDGPSNTAPEIIQPERSILLGHNLTPTVYTLPKGGFTVGNQVLAGAITKYLTLGTSPWLYYDYNMYSLIVRARGHFKTADATESGLCEVNGQNLDEHCGPSWGLQLMYLKTGHFQLDNYQMTAINSSFVVKQDVASFYSVNLALNYMYFFDETEPYSLRREPFNHDAYQWTLTTLQEVRLPAHLGALIEFGVLGLNYKYPEVHVGISMHHKTRYVLLQAGFSETFTTGTIGRLFNIDQSATLAVQRPGRDFSFHPEIQLQFFL